MFDFKTRLEASGYPKSLIEKNHISDLLCQTALKKQTNQTKGKLMPFVMTYHLRVKNLKQILMIQNQPLLKTIYKTLHLHLYHTKTVNRSKTCSLE